MEQICSCKAWLFCFVYFKKKPLGRYLPNQSDVLFNHVEYSITYLTAETKVSFKFCSPICQSQAIAPLLRVGFFFHWERCRRDQWSPAASCKYQVERFFFWDSSNLTMLTNMSEDALNFFFFGVLNRIIKRILTEFADNSSRRSSRGLCILHVNKPNARL